MLFKSYIVLVFLCGMASIAKATTCSASVNPCLTTLNVLNTCGGSTCTCSDSSTMTAIDTGCASSTYLGKPTVAAGVYSGEGLVGETMALTCTSATTASASATYKWFKSGVEDTGTTVTGYTHTVAANDNIDFTCQVVDGGITSESSDAFNVLAFANGGTISRVPAITGVFSQVATGSALSLQCTNIPLGSTVVKFQWSDNSDTNPLAVSSLSGQTETCTLVAVGANTLTLPTAASVTLPSGFTTPATLFTAVAITTPSSATTFKDGVGSNIVCSTTPDATTAVFAGGDIAYVWKVDGAAITPTTATILSTNLGGSAGNTYSVVCEGTPTSGTALVSSSVAITLSTTIIEDAIVYISPTVSGTTKVIVGNYLAARCIVSAPSLTGISYTWTYDSNAVVGNVDHTLQVYGVVDATHGNAKDYVCTATIGDFVETSAATTLTAIAVTAQAAAITSTATAFGTGDSYVLTCSLTENTESFGLTYTWYSDGTEVSGETASTYTITATGTAVVYKCRATFGGSNSGDSPNLSVQGTEVITVTASFALKPIQGLSYDFVCTYTASASAGAITFEWKKATTVVGTSATYTIASVAATDDGAYTCEVTAAGGNTLASSSQTVASVTSTPDAPTVSIPTITNTGGTYTLTCASASVATGTTATYEWTRDTTVITGETSSTYTISSLASSDGGSYTCKVTVNSVQSSASSGQTLTVGTAFGLPCATADYFTVCTTDFTKYTGNCIASRCECVSGVTLTQDACGASSGAHVLASVLTVLVALLGTLAL